MSRTPSSVSPGMQVTTGSANNVYTLLLVISLLVLAATAVYAAMVMHERFGCAVPFGDSYARANQKIQETKGDIERADSEVTATLERFSLGTGLTDGPAPKP